MQKLKMGNSILLPIWVAFIKVFDRAVQPWLRVVDIQLLTLNVDL